MLHPVGLDDVLDLDSDRDRLEVQGYERHALAPLRPAVLEAPGWYFGDGSLAMPVADLLKWDMSIMDRTLLKPASYEAFETSATLKSGKSANYGLGITVVTQNGHRVLEHSGEVGGFVSENVVLPEEKLAIAVLTNQEASTAASDIARAIGTLLLGKGKPPATAPTPEEAQLKGILSGLAARKIDRGLFTPDANFYFSDETLDDFALSLKPLGAIASVAKRSESLRGGMTYRSFEVQFAEGTSVTVSTYTMKDGKLEQLLVEGKN